MKYHFAVSATPLVEGSDLYALCGKVVQKAAFKVGPEVEAVMLIALRTSLFNLCQECKVLPFSERFIYVVCSGQEAMTGAA